MQATSSSDSTVEATVLDARNALEETEDGSAAQDEALKSLLDVAIAHAGTSSNRASSGREETEEVDDGAVAKAKELASALRRPDGMTLQSCLPPLETLAAHKPGLRALRMSNTIDAAVEGLGALSTSTSIEGEQIAALLGWLHFEILRGVPGVPNGWARVLHPPEEAVEIRAAIVDAVIRFFEQNHFQVVLDS